VSPLNRYTCEEVFRRIDEFLDRELRPGEIGLVRAHLETCAACASEYAFEESVLIGVREKLRRVAVPSELHDRIALRLAEARASRKTDS
jgi:anti-sigma factor (TIGR02949 family)